MCDMCSINEKVIGTVCGDWYLAQAQQDCTYLKVKAGDYVLTQGHSATFVLTVPPVPDPHWRFTDAQYDALTPKEFDSDASYFTAMYAMRDILDCDPRTGYELYGAALAAGYKPGPGDDSDGDLAVWLTHTMGLVIEKSAQRTSATPIPL